MKLVMPWQKVCPECEEFMEPTIFANPEDNPKELGNPWECKCGNLMGCKDGSSYAEHMEMIRKHYLKSSLKSNKTSGVKE